MPTPSPIFFLAMFTLLSLVGLAAWDLKKVEESIQRDERRDRR